jgi:hypothetical protein
MKKKLLSLLFCAILAVIVFPAISYAAEETEYPLPYYATTNLNETELSEYKEIREAVITGKSSYTFSEAVRTQAAADKIIARAQIYIQLLLYYDTYTFNLEDFEQENIKVTNNGFKLKLNFEYYLTQKSFKTALSRLDAAWEKVSKQFDSETSELTKVKYINDYICTKADYDLDAKYNYMAYGALYTGKAKCDGYARAFQFLAEKAGLKVVIALDDGTEEDPGHAWNKIKVGKSWYNIDVTNNDNTHDTGYILYDYFMLADSEYTAADEWDDPYIKEVKATNTKNSYYEMYKLTADTAEDALSKMTAISKTKTKEDTPFYMSYHITSNKEYKRLENFFDDNKNQLRETLGINFSIRIEWIFVETTQNIHVIIRT